MVTSVDVGYQEIIMNKVPCTSCEHGKLQNNPKRSTTSSVTDPPRSRDFF